MASMAARTNSIATLRLPGDVLMAGKNETATKLGFYSSRHVAMITRKNGNFSVRAGAGGTPRSVETINGKINGVHVGEATLFGNKNSIELINGDGDSPPHSSLHGKFVEERFVEERFVYRQTLVIRSYEIGPDKTATMETLMNLLQETALNHVTSSGLAGNGFGATREMSIRKLIWVVTQIHIQVQRYNSWHNGNAWYVYKFKPFTKGDVQKLVRDRGDVVEIDTWVDAAGKNGMRRDWIIRDYQTQEIITRATSTWVIMNRETRRLSKIPDQVRQEVLPFYLNRFAIAKDKNDSEKIDKLTDDTAERITSGLAPRWSDMDANQHVNNVKYIGWILESLPMNVLGDYDLTSMTLEYRRECRQSNLLESLTSTTSSLADDSNCKNNSINRRPDLEYTHLLRMQADKAEIVRARTEWNTKQKDKLH